MTITYTNRKNVTYTLCRGTTKTGKPRYDFAHEPKGEPVERIPQGYEIRESVNGVVSLARTRPQQIRPDERATVEAALKRHPKAGSFFWYRKRVLTAKAKGAKEEKKILCVDLDVFASSR